MADRQKGLETDCSKASHLLSLRVQAEETDLDMLRQLYTSAVLGLLRDEEHQLKNLQSLFCALDPRSVMAKGFALVRSSAGRVIPSAGLIQAGDSLVIQFNDGRVHAIADEVADDTL